jgi:hypothetical protein
MTRRYGVRWHWQKTVSSEIRLDRINAHPPSKYLRITVVEMETGRLRIFANSPDPSPIVYQFSPIVENHRNHHGEVIDTAQRS